MAQVDSLEFIDPKQCLCSIAACKKQYANNTDLTLNDHGERYLPGYYLVSIKNKSKISFITSCIFCQLALIIADVVADGNIDESVKGLKITSLEEDVTFFCARLVNNLDKSVLGNLRHKLLLFLGPAFDDRLKHPRKKAKPLPKKHDQTSPKNAVSGQRSSKHPQNHAARPGPKVANMATSGNTGVAATSQSTPTNSTTKIVTPVASNHIRQNHNASGGTQKEYRPIFRSPLSYTPQRKAAALAGDKIGQQFRSSEGIAPMLAQLQSDTDPDYAPSQNVSDNEREMNKRSSEKRRQGGLQASPLAGREQKAATKTPAAVASPKSAQTSTQSNKMSNYLDPAVGKPPSNPARGFKRPPEILPAENSTYPNGSELGRKEPVSVDLSDDEQQPPAANNEQTSARTQADVPSAVGAEDQPNGLKGALSYAQTTPERKQAQAEPRRQLQEQTLFVRELSPVAPAQDMEPRTLEKSSSGVGLMRQFNAAEEQRDDSDKDIHMLKERLEATKRKSKEMASERREVMEACRIKRRKLQDEDEKLRHREERILAGIRSFQAPLKVIQEKRQRKSKELDELSQVERDIETDGAANAASCASDSSYPTP